MPRSDDKQPQKTAPKKRTPPRVAEGPPPTPEGDRVYNETVLEQSSDYANIRSAQVSKPYGTENEAYAEKAKSERQAGKLKTHPGGRKPPDTH